MFTHFIAMFLSLLIGYSGPTCLINFKKKRKSDNVRRRVVTVNFLNISQFLQWLLKNHYNSLNKVDIFSENVPGFYCEGSKTETEPLTKREVKRKTRDQDSQVVI